MNLDYQLSPDGRFVIRNYNQKKPFSNFLPGIAGLYGIPMWAFYVNRGQGIASFGTRNKDNAILEFFPANKAYQTVTSLGFRTFLKLSRHGKGGVTPPLHYEPFREIPSDAGHAPEQVMEVSSHELLIRETNKALGLETTVRYFTVPGEPLAALAREVSVTNRLGGPLHLEVLDGLPAVSPFGMNQFFVKHMSRTIEAWMIAENLDRKAPFFRLKVDATDRPEVTVIEGGNFYFGGVEERGGLRLLDIIVDPAVIFGSVLDFSQPKHFFHPAPFKVPANQVCENKTPCAFAHASLPLPAGKTRTLRFLAGHAARLDKLNRYVGRVRRAGYFEEKRLENRACVESIKASIFSATSSSAYDLYCGQTYLDNALRGGVPVNLGVKDAPLWYHAYSRKHGDLERDYNQFVVEPTYFSQGNGSYRDVNQNRRNDVWFTPEVKDANIRVFLDLLQLDGFNPLVVKGVRFQLKRSAAAVNVLNRLFGKKGAGKLAAFLAQPFQPGELYGFLAEEGMARPARFAELMAALAPFLVREDSAEHGEGFWTDHWAYNLDLIDSYLAIYPEEWESLLFKKRDFAFFDNDHVVAPRSEKYVHDGSGQIRQFGAVVRDKEKSRLIALRAHSANLVRTRHGKGGVYRTDLFVKLLCLFSVKLASLDAQGKGVEMEADKPSWCDALNGLPGLLGSSLPETFELKRLAVFLVQSLEDLGVDLAAREALPEELFDLIRALDSSLKKHFSEPFHFWEAASSAKERFRGQTRTGLSGREKQMSLGEIKIFIEHGREKIEVGLESAFNKNDRLYPTYFENKAVRHRTERGKVRVSAFEQAPLPNFLEGPAHALKVEKDPARRRALLRAVRGSGLYDAKLGMYKVNDSLAKAPLEIGRTRVFAPGWLENESVFLHMEYKFLLEILRGGMEEEFFQDLKRALIPFQPAERYGRSVLENVSFIVSSAFRDPSLHGAGFVARLSGSTAEFLSMWLFMNIGKRPFTLGPDKKLSLRFEPHLPATFFTKEDSVRPFLTKDGKETKVRVPKNCVAFLFLGKTLVFYHNPKQLDTFGKQRVSVKKISLETSRGPAVEFKGDTIPSPYSGRVRDEFVPRIDIELG